MKIAVYRGLGGWGDVEMALVAAGSWKMAHMDADVTFVCPGPLLPLTENYPFIDRAIPSSSFRGSGPYVWFFNITAPCLNYEMRYQPNIDKSRIEIFCDWMNVKYNPSALKSNPLSYQEKVFARELIRENADKFVIGWVTQSYSPIRRIPTDTWREIVKITGERIPNCKNIVLRESRKSWEDMFWNPSEDVLMQGENIREVIRTLSACDLVIGPDTGPMHSASMMGIPSIWLFTHIDGKVRTKEYSNVTIVQGYCHLGKSPCWYTGGCDQDIAYFAPCARFDPEKVFNMIESIYLCSFKS